MGAGDGTDKMNAQSTSCIFRFLPESTRVVPQIKIGIQLSSLRQPFKKALHTAARLGARGVEIDARSEIRPDQLSQTGLRQIRKMLEDLDLRVCAVGFRTRRGYHVAEDLDARVAATKRAMKLAYDLGAELVTNQVELFTLLYATTSGAVMASMLAYIAAQYCDVYMFHFWKKLTGGKHLWLRNNGSTLVSQGVELCFANPGTSEMHFVAALDKVNGMRCVLGLFEGVVTAAADGYYRMADKPACTLLHLGPGLGNGLANLHNAKKAGSGIVNIVGEHATYHIQHNAPLTSDIEGVARPMSH